MKHPVIQFQHVSKHYVKQRLRYGMLSETLSRLFTVNRSPFTDHNIIHALDNVSFEVKKGETLGVIGPNGAGKSTILKLISKVTVLDSGQVTAAGLHPELTGRENIFLYGAILGMKKIDSTPKAVINRYHLLTP